MQYSYTLHMRTYVAVIDDSPEAMVALRFAARRANSTNGHVHVLAIIPPQDFVAWGGVQATLEAEARDHAEELLAAAAGAILDESGNHPTITVRQGQPIEVVRDILAADESIAALVLGASASGDPGPLVGYFTGAEAGSLPCPVMIVPGALTPEDIDRMS
jgi:nucleotide-binding universal stress UspA family protein